MMPLAISIFYKPNQDQSKLKKKAVWTIRAANISVYVMISVWAVVSVKENSFVIRQTINLILTYITVLFLC